MLAAIVLRHAE